MLLPTTTDASAQKHWARWGGAVWLDDDASIGSILTPPKRKNRGEEGNKEEREGTSGPR
jgi:hypothetical protein